MDHAPTIVSCFFVVRRIIIYSNLLTLFDSGRCYQQKSLNKQCRNGILPRINFLFFTVPSFSQKKYYQ